MAMEYNDNMYFYQFDGLGNIVGLVDTSGAVVASYVYDPWGRITSRSGSMNNINPFKFKGYYYDDETQFYYLMSRYYDPIVGRFINADGYASTGQGALGYNMYAYCGNNPVMYADYSGEAKTAVLYDGRTSGIFWGHIGGEGFSRQGKLIIENMQNMGYAVEGYSFTSISEFVVRWNEMSGEYDYIIIVSHGAAGSLDCAGQRIRYQNGDYSFSDLQNVNVTQSVHLYSCNGATIDQNGTSVAQQFSNLTNAPTVAVKDGKMNVSWSTGNPSNVGGKLTISHPSTCIYPQPLAQPQIGFDSLQRIIITSPKKSGGACR